MKSISIYLMLFCWLCVGCNEEEKLQASEDGEPFYTLPQGNHAYDPAIVEWFDRCGFYILYDFKETDLYWNNTEWKEGGGRLGEGFLGALLGKPADPDYVGEVLDMVERVFFKAYPEELLQEGMPLKFLLCSDLRIATKLRVRIPGTNTYETIEVWNQIVVEPGYDYLAVNGANSEITNLRDSMKYEYAAGLNSTFLARLCKNKILTDFPDAFFEVCEYNNKGYRGAELFKYGFLTTSSIDVQGTQETMPREDINAYFRLAGYPLEILEGKPGTIDSKNETNPPLHGALNPSRDVNGLVRQKYEIIINYLKGKGIDTDRLQHPLGKPVDR